MTAGIVFQVDTARVLQILAREIYDSPYALLRENLQNAYDAIRMRFAPEGTLSAGGHIEVLVADGEVTITDNGVGMTEEVLRNNFWKAGSSGKHSAAARQAGVIGTFGIGAMANFGVATRLTVETRAEGQAVSLRSIAVRDSLRLAEECVTLERLPDAGVIGTTVRAQLDIPQSISLAQAEQYLAPYVSLLPVPVTLNGRLISQGDVESRLPIRGRTFETLGALSLNDDLVSADFVVQVDSNGQVLVRVEGPRLGGLLAEGSVQLLQAGGQLMGLRSHFGLAPVPAIGHYQFGGFANLSFLLPTAGREALSRESIDQVNRFIGLAERAASELLATSSFADKNNAFLHWIAAHGRYDLVGNITVRVLPEDVETSLADVAARVGQKTMHHYSGTDKQIIATFANETSWLLQLAQSNPRRSVQAHYVSSVLGIAAVPDSATITRTYLPNDLTLGEISVLLRITAILRDDYLIPDAEVVLADISHGVPVLALRDGSHLRLHIAKTSTLLPPLLACRETAYDIFTQFMKDFVRLHIYPVIQSFVPSSTQAGVDALRALLERNRELYRYEQTEFGDMEGVLGELLERKASFNEILEIARGRVPAQTQTVSPEQVGTVEAVVPGVVESPMAPAAPEFSPIPPILREEIATDMKVLTSSTQYPQLNNFRLLLGLSDRLMRTEGQFFRGPHTTRIMWGGHRVTYIFSEATGRLSLYYDIELRDPLASENTGGGPLATTTLITKRRIFVPVPDVLMDQFQITAGRREFFVRFDILTSDLS